MRNIILLNQPKLSEYDLGRKFDERRMGLVPIIKEYVSGHDLFKGGDVSVYFIETGAGSLVARIEAGEKKFILKVPLSLAFSKGEALFLSVWEKAGVKVPRVYEEGMFGELSYVLMEYIDAPVITGRYSLEESLERGIYVGLGKTLRIMHAPKAEGFGCVVDGKAEYSRFGDWLKGPDMKKRVDYVKEHGLLGPEHGSLSVAYEVMTAYVESENRSSYCHDDFGTSNIFDTDPITVFDPNPRFNNGYLDLGRSIVILATHRATAQIEQLIEGYFGGERYDARALQAAVLINATMKLPYSHKKGRLEMVSNVQKYLAERRGVLEG